MNERLKDFEEAIDQMIHNYQSMVDSENRSKTELYAKNYVDYREFSVEAYKKALSRVEELEEENKRYREAIRECIERMNAGGAGTRSFVYEKLSEALEGEE